MKALFNVFLLLTVNMLFSQDTEQQVKVDLVIERVKGFSANDRIEDITVEDDMLWFAGNDGVSSINSVSGTLSKIIGKSYAVSVTVGRKGKVYSAFKNNDIYVDDELFYTITTPGVLISDIELFQGKLWIGTNQGLHVISTNSGKLLDIFTPLNSKLKSEEINFIQYFKKLDNLWIGTSNGVNEIKSTQKWSKTDFPDENFIASTVSIDGVWLLSDKELHLAYEDFGIARFQDQGLKQGLFEGTVNDLALDNEDNLFVASNILTRYNPYSDRLDKYGESIGLVASKCISLASDRQGALWLGTENAGLFRIYKDSIDIGEMTITTILENPISCPGAMDGSLRVDVSGGSPPYHYYWERVRLKGQSNPKNLKSGNYKVTVEDDYGNRQTASIKIDDPQNLSFKIVSSAPVSSVSKKDGFAQIQVFGGTPPYSYNWGNGETKSVAKKLSFGFTYLTITDANGCTLEDQINIGKPKIMPDLDIDKLKVGQTLALNKLFFKADSSTIQDESLEVIEEVYDFLLSNEKVVIEIGGHTNDIPTHEYCDKLSTSRAKSIADYLYQRGISRERISFKGYGKRNPVASNRSASGRRKNQRVEIKIVQLDG